MTSSAENTATEDPTLPPCLVLDSRRSSSLQKAATLLKEGKVVGVPTDTVYALAASCQRPASISRLYHVKGRPPEKPICLCLASLDQLEAAKPPFSELLWDFMRRCYPGGDRIDAMICDGRSSHLAPSTVVNCLHIDQGRISYFREGCTALEHVDRLFLDAQEAINNHHRGH